MTLDTLLKKSKSFIAVPVLSLVLTYSPLYSKNHDISPKIKDTSVIKTNTVNVIENYTINYDVGVYILGIKFFSADADFYYKKIEENGSIDEIMGADGRYSSKYYGSFLTVFSKNKDPFEKHSYFINYDQKVFKNEAVFYNDKIKIVKNGLEKIIDDDSCVGLQSVIKPVLTEGLFPGLTFRSKTFVEDDFYECKFIVEEKENIKVKDKYVDAYHVVLKTGSKKSRMSKAADLWVIESKPHNKIVKISFSPFILTEVKVFLDS